MADKYDQNIDETQVMDQVEMEYQQDRDRKEFTDPKDVVVDLDHNKSDQAAVREKLADTFEDRTVLTKSIINTVLTDPDTNVRLNPNITEREKESLLAQVHSEDDTFWTDRLVPSLITQHDFIKLDSRLERELDVNIKDLMTSIAVEEVRGDKLAALYDDAVAKYDEEYTNHTKSNQVAAAEKEELEGQVEERDNKIKALTIGLIVAVVALVIALGFLFWPSSGPEIDPEDLSDNPEVASLQQDVMDRDGTIEDLNAQLGQARDEASSAQDDANQARQDLERAQNDSDASGQIRDLQGRLDDANGRADRAEQNVADLKRDLQQARDRVSDLERDLNNAGNTTETVTTTVTAPAPAN